LSTCSGRVTNLEPYAHVGGGPKTFFTSLLILFLSWLGCAGHDIRRPAKNTIRVEPGLIFWAVLKHLGFCRAPAYTARRRRLMARYGNPVGSPATLSSKSRQVRKEATVVVMCVPGSGWQGGLPLYLCVPLQGRQNPA